MTTNNIPPKEDKYLQLLVVHRGFTKISDGNLTRSMVLSDLFFRCARGGQEPDEFVTCNATHEDIRDDINDGMNEKTVRRALKFFEEAGYLSKVTRKRGGKNQGSTITLHLKMICEAVADTGCRIPLYGPAKYDLGKFFGLTESSPVEEKPAKPKKAGNPAKPVRKRNLGNFGSRMAYIRDESGVANEERIKQHYNKLVKESGQTEKSMLAGEKQALCDGVIAILRKAEYWKNFDKAKAIKLVRAWTDNVKWPKAIEMAEFYLGELQRLWSDDFADQGIESPCVIKRWIDGHKKNRKFFVEQEKAEAAKEAAKEASFEDVYPSVDEEQFVQAQVV
jgi:hypothetical protein